MIEKRGHLHRDSQFVEGHPTVSAIAPLICFAAVFTILVLLRLVFIFSTRTQYCIGADEFWYTSTGGDWPLIGSLFLVLFLLFLWNIFIGIDSWRGTIGTRITVVVNAVAIAAMLYFCTIIQVSAELAFGSRTGLYDIVKSRPFIMSSRRTEIACVTMRRFAGRWRVVDRKLGYYGFDIPAEWIELKSWGIAYAQDANSLQPYTTWWQAPRWRAPYQDRHSADERWRDGVVFYVLWDFDLRGDTLILSSSQEWFEYEWLRSTITLERQSIPEQPVFPNPY